MRTPHKIITRTRRGKLTAIPQSLTWFKPQNYKQASKLSTAAWYEQLLVRSYLISYFRGTLVEVDKTAISKLLNCWSLIKDKGLIKVPPAELSIFPDGRRLKNIKENGNLDLYKGTRPLSVIMFNSIQREFEAAEKRKDDQSKRINSRWSKLEAPITDFLPDRFRSRDLIEVDLKLPLELLIKQFKARVSARKHSLEIKSTLNIAKSKNLKSWLRYKTAQWNECRILPYLDLLIWKLQTDADLKNPAIADLVFPDGLKDGTSARRTVRKNAEEAISVECLQILSALAVEK